MRELGYAVIDALVEHGDGLPHRPVTSRATPEEVDSLLREPVPTEGEDPIALVRFVVDELLPRCMHLDHPRFFAFVPGPSNFVSAMADALVAGMNPYVTTWLEGSALAGTELVAIEWLAELLGFPATTEGVLFSGGSMANATAIALAREHQLGGPAADGVLYCSDQTHSSVLRGARLIGLDSTQVVVLESDASFRINPSVLAREVARHRAEGRRPFCVVGNAGTTSTAAVDPLPDLAELCAREGLWLHIDGAYGAPAALCDEGAALLKGLPQADSLTVDPHKWLFQPYEIGCLLVRRPGLLEQVYRVLPPYLEAIDGSRAEVNLCDRGPELTRVARGVKLWMSLKAFGVDAFRESIARGMELARIAERSVAEKDGWEISSPAQLGVVCFRFAPPGMQEAEADEANATIADAMTEDGEAMVATTVLRGRKVLRMCLINPRTTDEDVERTVSRLADLATTTLGDRH
jgi:aromatic-L-amino-acid/L-tryptophan decarboxylase